MPATAKPFRKASIVLYQPESVLQERFSGDVTDLVGYVKRLEDECNHFFSAAGQPAAVDIVVALKPGRRSRVWFANAVGAATGQDLKALARRLEQVPAAQVKGGLFAFAIRASVRGGEPVPLRSPPPIPDDWRTAISAHPGKDLALLPDEPIRILWPD